MAKRKPAKSNDLKDKTIHRGDLFKDQNKKSSGKNKAKSSQKWPSIWDE